MLNSSLKAGIRLLTAGLLLFCLPAVCHGVDEEGCYRCHGLEGFFAQEGGEARQLGVSASFFESSVHSLLNCRECHSDISSIPHQNASKQISCGQICHQRDQKGNPYSHESLFWNYTTSVHGETKAEKISCMVCHPASSLKETARRDLVAEVRQCAACHTESGHVRTYFRDVHYLALSRGNRRAPSCPDCHTAHRILAPDNGESSVHPGQLADTCTSGAIPPGLAGRCHDGASEKTLRGAGMNPLVLPDWNPGLAGWSFSVLYWMLLLGLVLRAFVGLLRGR
jgi:hypothetical protein